MPTGLGSRPTFSCSHPKRSAAWPAPGGTRSTRAPLLEPRWHRRKQQHHAQELGPRELHPEVGGEAYLQAEECGDDPEADDYSFGAGDAQVRGREGATGHAAGVAAALHAA